MKELSPQSLKQIMAEVQLAPTAHNTQPFFWTYENKTFKVSIKADRRLPVADPNDQDLLLGLGAQIEGLSIALEKRSYRISTINKRGDDYFIEIDPTPQHSEIDLSPYVKSRRTFRGSYKNNDSAKVDEVKTALSDIENILLIEDREQINQIAKLYDQATAKLMEQEAYLKELYQWLRFSRSNPKWYKDGLNQESMSLTGFESFFAKQILKPRIYKMLHKTGLGPLLISEASKVKSSSLIFCLLGDEQDKEDPIQLGRQFYRSWLLMEKYGFSLCPLSNLVDHPETNSALQTVLERPSHSKVLKIFRAGPRPGEKRIPRVFREDLNDFFQMKGIE